MKKLYCYLKKKKNTRFIVKIKFMTLTKYKNIKKKLIFKIAKKCFYI